MGTDDVFTLSDIDTAAIAEHLDVLAELSLRAYFADGSVELIVRTLNPEDDTRPIEDLLIDLKSRNDELRLAGLSAEDRAEYAELGYQDCRCDGSCWEVCWYSMLDQECWLDERAPGALVVQWRWTLGSRPGSMGGAVVTQESTFNLEGSCLASGIASVVVW